MKSYQDIVIGGYLTNRDKLPEYYYREYKKRKHTGKDEFFHYCKKEVDNLFENLERSLNERKRELYLILDVSKNKDTILRAKQELSSVNLNNFYVNLSAFTRNKHMGQLSYAHIQFIQDAINEAKQMTDANMKRTEQIKPLDIQKASHKILMLHKLGVLDYLKETYSVFTIDTNTTLTKLLAPLLNENPETIRKALTDLDNPRAKHPVINKTSLKKVRAELIKLGIETETLPDL